MSEIVKVRIWASGLALVQAEDRIDTHLQLADNALRAALGDRIEGYFEAWLPDRGADWIIGREIEDQSW